MITDQLSGLIYPAINLIKVDLPHHEGPTRAVLCHHNIVNDRLSNTFSDQGYSYDMFLRSTTHLFWINTSHSNNQISFGASSKVDRSFSITFQSFTIFLYQFINCTITPSITSINHNKAVNVLNVISHLKYRLAPRIYTDSLNIVIMILGTLNIRDCGTACSNA